MFISHHNTSSNNNNSSSNYDTKIQNDLHYNKWNNNNNNNNSNNNSNKCNIAQKVCMFRNQGINYKTVSSNNDGVS